MTGNRIPLARPSLGGADIAAACAAIESGRLVLGPRGERFERALAVRTRRGFAVAVASGTAAIELALWALGVGDGDEVIVPAFGFPAAAHAAVRLRAVPVPVDVDPRTWNLDTDAARAAVTERTRVCIAIDQFGLVADDTRLAELSADTGVAILADSACSLGSANANGVPGGGYGVAAVLSFHPRKVITTGEGGAVLCDDPDLAATLRSLRNLGQAGPGQFERAGTNARMSEVAAAIGCAQIERLDAMVAERRLLAAGYAERLAPLVESGRICPQHVPPGSSHNVQTYAVRLARGLSRDRVRDRMSAAGVETGPGTYAVTRLAPFAAYARPAPVAEELHDQSLALPLFVGMRSADLDRVCDALAEAVA
ncbi:MAG: DegT/DnrJ/EryC1/StrS family aminotransferase [Deltaproteobacteria bacterium]|nr:MAG: DegT/DnrJ/EryC1/StrS family aminotransferase [Deltaproteobacteria bacterium]